MSFSDSMKFVAFFTIILSMAISPSFSNITFANEGTYVNSISSVAYTTAAADKGTNALVKINATTYALAYAGADNDGFITTYDVASDGTISALGTLEHDTADALHHSMVFREAYTDDCTNNYLGCVDTLILSYEAADNDLTISTFNFTTFLSGNGYNAGGLTPVKAVLTLGATPTEILATNVATPNSLVQVDDDAFAVAYADAAGDGTVSTFIVNSSGAILTSQLQTYEYGDTGSISGTAPTQELVKIDAATFAAVNRGAADDGFVSTFDINGTGAINTSVSQNYEFDTTDSEDFSAILLDSDTLVIASTNEAGGAITTVTINSTGAVSAGKQVVHDATSAAGNDLVKIDADTVALAYSGTLNTGGSVSTTVKSFTIDTTNVAGKTITEVNNHEFNDIVGTVHNLVQAGTSDDYVLASNTASATASVTHLQIKTASAQTTPAPNFGCYDCVKPQLMDAQITSSGAKITTNDDSSVDVIAEVGDSIDVTIKVTDNKSVDSLRAASLYTNFQDRPDDMNLYYSNNYDSTSYGSNLNTISTSFYQWNSGNDDVAFDQVGTITWGSADVTIEEEKLTFSNAAYKNDGGVVQVANVSFDMTFNGPIDSSEVWVEARDAAGNHFDIQLPMTLTVVGDAALDFNSNGDQKLLAFFDKSFLSAMVSNWNDSEGGVEELSTILGIPDENLPSWTTSLAKWVATDEIDVADMIVAVEHIINQ